MNAIDKDNETRRKKLLQLSRLYYEKGVRVHYTNANFVEYIRMQCNRLELQEHLADGTRLLTVIICSIYLHQFSSYTFFQIHPAASTANLKMRFQNQSLDIVKQSSEVLAALACNPQPAAANWLREMLSLLQTTLRNLIKSSITHNKLTKQADTNKKLYALSLRRDESDYANKDKVATTIYRVSMALSGEFW